MPKLDALIAGSTGYIGVQLIKLLIKHKNINIKYLCGSKSVGKNISSYDKSLKLFCFDLNVMCDNEKSCANEITPSGTLSVELSFKNATEKPFMLLMYAFNEAQLRIDNERKSYITVNHS